MAEVLDFVARGRDQGAVDTINRIRQAYLELAKAQQQGGGLQAHAKQLQSMAKEMTGLSRIVSGLPQQTKYINDWTKQWREMRSQVGEVTNVLTRELIPGLAGVNITTIGAASALGLLISKIKDTITESRNYLELGRRTGFATEKIEELNYAATAFGLTMPEINDGLDQLSDKLTQLGKVTGGPLLEKMFLQPGGREAVLEFRKIEKSTDSITEKKRKQLEVYLDYARVLDKERGPQQARSILRDEGLPEFGVNLARKSKKEVDDFLDAIRKRLGPALDPTKIEANAKAWALLQGSISGVSKEVTRHFIDNMTNLNTALGDYIEKNKATISGNLVQSVNTLATGLNTLLTAIKQADEWLQSHGLEKKEGDEGPEPLSKGFNYYLGGEGTAAAARARRAARRARREMAPAGEQPPPPPERGTAAWFFKGLGFQGGSADTPGGPALLHPHEMVLPKEVADTVRNAVGGGLGDLGKRYEAEEGKRKLEENTRELHELNTKMQRMLDNQLGIGAPGGVGAPGVGPGTGLAGTPSGEAGRRPGQPPVAPGAPPPKTAAPPPQTMPGATPITPGFTPGPAVPPGTKFVPAMADGGITKGPSLVGESGAEAVIPLDPAKFNKMFRGSPLEGHAAEFEAAARSHGIPPNLMAAIVAQESGHGRTIVGNNISGIMTGPGMKAKKVFATLGEGINQAAAVMKKNWDAGGHNITGMGNRYAPTNPRPANDPHGQNKSWIPGVTAMAGQLGGIGGSPGAGAGAGPTVYMVKTRAGSANIIDASMFTGPTRLPNLAGGSAGDKFYGVGGYNFMGSARSRAMGMDIKSYSAEAQMQFPTGIVGGGGGAGHAPAFIRANKFAGPDIAGFLKDLHDAGAPFTQYSGVYSYRAPGTPQMHPRGNAVDIETGFGSGPGNSPALFAWAQAHPQEFADIQAKHHMKNLTPYDWGHFEWSPERLATPAEIAARSGAPLVVRMVKTRPAGEGAVAGPGAPSGPAEMLTPKSLTGIAPPGFKRPGPDVSQERIMRPPEASASISQERVMQPPPVKAPPPPEAKAPVKSRGAMEDPFGGVDKLQHGAWNVLGGLAQLHKGEMVLPRSIADIIRQGQGMLGQMGGIGGLLKGGGGGLGGLLSHIPQLGQLSGMAEQAIHKIEGSASLDVNVNAPHGTNVRASAEGLFKQVLLNRRLTMPYADEHGAHEQLGR